MSRVSEKTIESYLMSTVRKYGGYAYKFTSPSRRAVPDRLCVLPGGRTHFVECKAEGQRVRKAQAREIAKIQELGCNVHVVSSIEEVQALARRYF